MAEEILEGIRSIPSYFDTQTTEFINECLLDPNIPEVAYCNDPVQRFHAFVKSWNIRKEKTTSSNQHIGHYKACIQHDFLGWCLFQRHEIPATTGYSPKRHRKFIDLSILKRSGNNNIDKQRTLGLLDSELNQQLMELGRSGMNNALTHNLIATEQYSRPRRSAIEHALNRVLTFDHFLYLRTPFCVASCDLKGCYDRIIHIAAYLALRKAGVPRTRLLAMFKTIQHMIHKVRTSYGDSSSTYGGEFKGYWDNFAQGILQGNASGPQVWSILSSVIFKILHKRGHSTTFCTSLSRMLFEMLGFSYVDDCDLIQAKSTITETVDSMQALIDDWTKYMLVTGGKVEATKSWWYYGQVTWKKGWKIDNVHIEKNLSITFEGTPTNLKRLGVQDSSEMLGIWMAPNGNHHKMKRHLRQTTLAWASKLKLGNPTNIVAWTALHKTISAKMKYSMAVSRFTQKECDYIMAPAITVGLTRSGINRNFPKDARHAPITSGGLHVLQLYNEMGVTRTNMILEHCFNKTPTGRFITINIEHLVLEAGLFGTIWDMNVDTLEKYCTTSTWIFHTIKFNFQNNIKINTPHMELQPRRQNDKAIMDLAHRYTQDSKTLKAINRIRMIHEITHLSDITTANGKYLDPAFLQTHFLLAKKNHPYQPI